jgi:hypothetical protein
MGHGVNMVLARFYKKELFWGTVASGLLAVACLETWYNDYHMRKNDRVHVPQTSYLTLLVEHP